MKPWLAWLIVEMVAVAIIGMLILLVWLTVKILFRVRPDTAVVIVKGACYLGAGFVAPLTSGLAQWVNDGRWPPGIVWIVISGTCFGGAFNSVLAFLSGSWGDYVKGRANGSAHPGDTTQMLISKFGKPEPPKQ